MLLMPPSLSDCVPEGRLARMVGGLALTLDLSEIDEDLVFMNSLGPSHVWVNDGTGGRMRLT